MTAQMCILLIPSVFSHVFCLLLQPSMAMPIPDRGSTPSLLGGVGRKGCPIGATEDIMDRVHSRAAPTAGML